MNDALDHVRSQTLKRIETNRKIYLSMLVLCGLAELAGLICVLWLMDWSDQTHCLILACTMLVYITLGLWVFALSHRHRMGEQRLLYAIEILQESQSKLAAVDQKS